MPALANNESSDEEDTLFNRQPRGSVDNSTPRRMYFLSALAAIGGFLFGYDTGVVSGAMVLVRAELGLNDVWHELVVSGTLAAAFLAALGAGSLADRCGRRPTILAASGNFLVGAVVMGCARDKVVLLLGRVVVGVGVGLASHAVPLYIGECATPEMRGSLVTLNIVAVTFGQLSAGLLCGALVNTAEGWRWMLGLAGVPALIQLVGFFFMPESPRYLVQTRRLQQAKAVLSKIRSPYHQIEDELEDMKIAANSEAATAATSLSLSAFLYSLTASDQGISVRRRSVLLGCLLQLCQQFAGINTVMYYAASIIKMAGASDTVAVWFSAVTAGFNFLLSLVGLRLVERLSRRGLLLGSLVLVVISLLSISSSFAYMDMQDTNNSIGRFSSNSSQHAVITSSSVHFYAENRTASAGPILVLVCLCCYIISFAPGMGPLPWTINSELHPSDCRAKALSLSTATNWISNLVVSLTFLSMVAGIGRTLTFVVYAVITAVSGVILYMYLPETKGVKLEDTEDLFQQDRQRFGSVGSSSGRGGAHYSPLEQDGD